MARLHSVVLPREAQPRFPDKCVVTGKPNPGATASLIARDPSEVSSVISGWIAVRVPCCREHRRGLIVRHVLGSFLTLALLGLGGFLGILFGAFHISRWLGQAPPIEWLCAGAFGVVVVSLVGLYLWNWRHPAWFTFEVYADSMEYQFLRDDYAAEFSRLNSAEAQPRAALVMLSEAQAELLQKGGKLLLRSGEESDQELAYTLTRLGGDVPLPNKSLQQTGPA